MKGTAVTDSFTRTLATGWGSTTTGQAWSLEGLGGTIVSSDWSVNGTQGLVSVPVTAGYRHAYLGTFSQPYVDLAVDASIAVVPTGGAIEICNLSVRGTSSTSYYLYRVQVETSASVTVMILAPGGATLGSITVPGITYTANLKLRVRVQAVGKVFRAKVWQAANPEPPNYVLTVVDGTYTGAGWVGVRAGVASGNTNALPIAFTFDNFSSVLVPDFPRDSVPLTVLAAFGADLSKDPSTWTWTNITTDVRHQSVVITPGRADETSQAASASCTFQLLNDAMAYSANNPMGPNYPNVKRNTPVWVMIDPATRFFGYINGFVPSWDPSGKMAIVSVSANGILRRLTQGKSPLRSVLYRSTVAAKPAAHWSLEEGSTSTSFAESAGRAPMSFLGTPPKRATGGPPGSAPLVTLAADTSLVGTVAPYTETSPGWWGVQMVIRVPSDPGKETPMLVVHIGGGTYARWELWYNWQASGAHGMYWYIYDQAGAVTSFAANTNVAAAFPDGKMYGHDIIIGWNAHQSGGNILLDGGFASPDDPSGQRLTVTASLPGTNGKVVRIEVPARSGYPHADWTYGHLSVWPGQFSLYDQQMFGLAGETVTARLNRLCTEQGVPIAITGTSTTTMGPQSIDTFVNLLRECEAADMGLLYDGFGPGLGYVTRSARYNLPTSMTLDMAADPPQVNNPFTPADDDQRNRNLWKVDRKNGSSATYEDKTGTLGTAAIGTYDSSVTLNVAADNVLPGYASWLVHMGTMEGFRYPNLSIDLGSNPELIDNWISAKLNSHIDVLNVSSKATGHTAGTVSVLDEGYTETITPKTYTVAANASPFGPWQVAAVGQDRVDSANSTVRTTVAAGAASVQVNVGTVLWTTDGTKLPAGGLPMNMDGIRVLVTAISGVTSPQTFTLDPATVVKSLVAGRPVRLWTPAVVAL